MLLLKQIRLERGLSQQKVAEGIGVSCVVYSRYETGARQPSMEMIAKLAEFLNVSADEIIGINKKQPDAEESPLVAQIASKLNQLNDDQLYELRGYIAGKFGK